MSTTARPEHSSPSATDASASNHREPRPRLSEAVSSLAPSGIRRFFDLVANMPDVISLSVGEPDFRTPDLVCDAAREILDGGWLGYSGNQGFPETRDSIARYMKRRFDATFDPAKEIMVTVGASQALDIAMRALLNPGDEVLVVEPSYVAYKPLIHLAGGVPVGVPSYLKDGYQPRIEAFEKAVTPKTRAILLGYPNNPTGATYDESLLHDLSILAEREDLIVISDEIYGELTYDRRHICFANVPGMKHRCIVIGGMSKAHSMTGWRLGYACAPNDLMAGMLKVHQYSMLSAPTLAQKAAVTALDDGDDEVERMKAAYERRRHIVHRAFNKMGLPCPLPGGAFYAFPDISSTGMDDVAFCEGLLKAKNVAVVPGSAFGEIGEGFIRIALTRSEAVLSEAMELIESYVRSL